LILHLAGFFKLVQQVLWPCIGRVWKARHSHAASSVIAVVIYAGLIGLTILGFSRVPTGFVPTQDKGYLVSFAQLPNGATLDRTEE